MADDHPRPTENDNQDADSRTPRDRDPDSEARPDDGSSESEADRGAASDADRADETPTESADASEVEDPTDATDAPEAGDPVESTEANSAESTETNSAETADGPDADADSQASEIPEDVRKYERFKKMDGAQYDRVNEFLRERTYITAREWAIARLCADFRTETGVEMTKIGENLPELVPFMTDTYTPQAVNQARASFEDKVRQAGATFLYGAMSGFFTAEQLDDMMYEVTEVAKFLLEVEGVDLSVEEELDAEDRISEVMREVQSASEQLRHDELACPNCGTELEASEADPVESDD